MAHTCAQYLSAIRGEDSLENQENIYHSLVPQGNLRLVSIWITDMEKFRVFHPGDTFPKTGQPVLEFLCSKHPEARPLKARRLESY